jgi:DNA topoisomerase I
LTKRLVIVESPAKSRTVGRFLGSGYVVKPSIGHIRDLPANRLGVDIENDFAPRYVIPEKKKEVVRGLRAEAKDADEIYLATDPDREGEAISWHLQAALSSALKNKPVHRVVFHEITKGAIDEAFAHAREIDENLVDAQQARRILDRLVGYSLSPLLRRKMSKNHLSAGRVQSVAVRLVVEREREIDAFLPVEYWSVEAELGRQVPKRAKRDIFRADLVQVHGLKFECHVGAEAKQLQAGLETARYAVADVRKKEQQRNPSPPFITSTLQQEASRKLGFTAKRTMAVAQGLYEGMPVGDEGIVGLITYMRTDSTNIAEVAQQEAKRFITGKYGADYYPHTPRQFKAKSKGAQEAHEAIRPTSAFREPLKIKEYLAPEQFKLYDLIWKRFLASQMAAAVMDTTSVDIRADRATVPAAGGTPDYLFRANGAVLKFPGFMAVYVESKDEAETVDGDEEGKKALPPLSVQEALDLLGIFAEQHFTQPPPRYTEATLIRALEEAGIGRPSTYAPTLSTIQDRGYVERMEGRRLRPTEIGFITNDLLVKHFAEIVNVGFTSSMEEELDEIASGQRQWVPMMRDFYGPYKDLLDKAEINMESVTIPVETTDIVCDKCGAPMVIKRGRFGRFLACSTFPKCRNARSIAVGTGVACPECKQGELVEKKTRRKRLFYSCSRYPECKFAVWNRPVLVPCPSCGGLVTEAGKKDGGRYVCVACGTAMDELPVLPTPVAADAT